MQSLSIVICVLLIGVAYGVPYSSNFDKIDVEEVLHNERLLKNYVDCFLDIGVCSPEAADIKKIIPEGMKEKCAKCTESQKKTVEKVVSFLIKEKPDIYNKLVEKFDPDNKYRKEYEESLKKIQE